MPNNLAPSRLLLHVLTDHDLAQGRDMLTVARAALEGGATVIQLRDKLANTRTLVEEGLALRTLTRAYNALLIVNDRIDVALAVDADGAHIGQDDMPASLARTLLGTNRLLGVSAGNLDEAYLAVEAGADYLGVGPIYTTHSKIDAGHPVGLPLLHELANRYTVPLVAIGGIKVNSVVDILQSGASGVAVISAIVASDDITAATREFIERSHQIGNKK